MTCKGWARVTSERTCRSYQVLVPELGALMCRWPVFGYVVCLPVGPQATITPFGAAQRRDLVRRAVPDSHDVNFSGHARKVAARRLRGLPPGGSLFAEVAP